MDTQASEFLAAHVAANVRLQNRWKSVCSPEGEDTHAVAPDARRSCSVGDQANLYCLGEIKLGPKCVIAQEAYLCTGTHDFTDPSMALITARIEVGTDAFVAARAFVMPGVCIGARP